MKSKPWTFEEKQTLKANYPKVGATACMKLLPGRTWEAIKTQAQQLGVKSPKPKTRPDKWTTNESIDAEIRKTYQGERAVGAIASLCSRILRPRSWVEKRAAKLGVRPMVGETRWSQTEITILDTYIHESVRKIQKRLRHCGFKRSEGSISSKRHKLELIPRNDPGVYSAAQLAGLMGVHEQTVIRNWIRNGKLKAKSTEHGYKIRDSDIKQFIVDHAAGINIRSVDKFWFIDLLTQKSHRREKFEKPIKEKDICQRLH